MNFTTNHFNHSLISTICNDQVIIDNITKVGFLSTLYKDTVETEQFYLMDAESRKDLVEAAILANDELFNQQIEKLNSAEGKEHFDLLRNLFVIYQQDIYIAEGDTVGFVTYHYKENDLLVMAKKSYDELTEMSEGLTMEKDGVFYCPAAIIDFNQLTMTICMPADMIKYVGEVGEINFNNNLKRLEDFPELKAAVEVLYA